jgi:hypothetical protein
LSELLTLEEAAIDRTADTHNLVEELLVDKQEIAVDYIPRGVLLLSLSLFERSRHQLLQ